MKNKEIKNKFTEWVKNHPDVWEDNRFWFAQNAVGTLLGFPDWGSEFVSELLQDKQEYCNICNQPSDNLNSEGVCGDCL